MNPVQPSIFNYDDPRRFLLDWLVTRQSGDPTFSMRKWAREMDISHALLVMLLQGKRIIKLKHVPTFARNVQLDHREKNYFQALVELENVRSIEEESLARLRLRELNPTANVRTREVDEFEMISGWIHFALLALCDLESFDGSLAFFEACLKTKASVNEIRAAVARLESLQLLGRFPDGRYFATQTEVTTKNDHGRAAVKKYHSEISQLAARAVLEQDVTEREFQSMAVSVHRDQIPEVKKMLRKFRSELVEFLSARKGTEVYNVNLQFFRLTESPAAFARAEDEGVDTDSVPSSQGVLSC